MNIKFDYGNIDTKVVCLLSEGLNNLRNAINKSSQLIVPSDFQYAYFLNNLESELTGIYNSLSNIKDYLYRSNLEYERLLNELINQANNINNIMIDRQETQIN